MVIIEVTQQNIRVVCGIRMLLTPEKMSLALLFVQECNMAQVWWQRLGLIAPIRILFSVATMRWTHLLRLLFLIWRLYIAFLGHTRVTTLICLWVFHHSVFSMILRWYTSTNYLLWIWRIRRIYNIIYISLHIHDCRVVWRKAPFTINDIFILVNAAWQL